MIIYRIIAINKYKQSVFYLFDQFFFYFNKQTNTKSLINVCLIEENRFKTVNTPISIKKTDSLEKQSDVSLRFCKNTVSFLQNIFFYTNYALNFFKNLGNAVSLLIYCRISQHNIPVSLLVFLVLIIEEIRDKVLPILRF